MKKLERNLIDNILESEVKLGCASTPVTSYYPESSLDELLDRNNDELPVKIAEFLEIEKDCLGKVRIEELGDEKGRYAVRVPIEGFDWVRANYQPSDFMKDFVQEIRKPDNTLAGITDLFKRYSPEVSIIKVNENAWAFYFSDENIDPYVYYIEQNVFGLEYHRFTRESYNKMMSEAGK